MQRRTVITIGLTLMLATATSAAADEAPYASGALARAARSLFNVATPTSAHAGTAPSAAKLQQAPAPQPPAVTTTDVNEHQFGVGLRAGGVAFGLGGSVRYFFYGGQFGVQGEVAHYRLELGDEEWSAIQFSPSAIYRFGDQKFAGPAHLTPYVGVGLSFVHTDFGDLGDVVDPLLLDETSVGVLFLGGMELFFDKFPNLSFSGELTFISNHEDLNANTASLPWPSFVAAAHWYFW